MSATMKRIKLQVTVLSMILSLSTSINEPLVWIEPLSPLLPRETRGNVPGYHDESIWLVGGVSNIDTPVELLNLMSYNVTNNSFTLHPDLSQTIVSSWSQNWAQIDDTLYIHQQATSWIGTFNLTSKVYVNNAINTPNIAYYPCITHFNGRYLILLSGNINYYNQLKIFDLTTDQWFSGPPMPGDGRRFFTCNTVNGFLYAIGGAKTFTSVLYDTVIMLEIDNISNITNTWIQLTDTLSIGRQRLRSVVYHDLIFVLGGKDLLDEIRGNVDIINTTSNTIFFNSNLSRPLFDIAPITVDDTLFVLSGRPLSNQWQYALLSDASTTSVPTTTTTSVLTTTEQSTTSDLTTSISTTFECGHNKNSGPGKAIQCTSDEDCCDGFSCRTKDGPKKGKCGRDKNKNKKAKHKENRDSSNESKSKNKKRSDCSDDKKSKKYWSDESVETDNAVVNDRGDISASSFDNNVRKNNNITWIILLVGVSVIFCVMCLILICYKHLCPKQRVNKNKYDTVSIIVSQ